MIVENTLKDREKDYGKYVDMADFAQELKRLFRTQTSWSFSMSFDKRESLDMIATKIARIMFGDPNNKDSWHDIAGYATLIEKELEENK